MNLHEWGDEKDCFTKEDLTTLLVSFLPQSFNANTLLDRKHTMKATENRTRTSTTRKGDEDGKSLNIMNEQLF